MEEKQKIDVAVFRYSVIQDFVGGIMLNHVQMVTKTTSALWNEYIDRYYYLGHKPLPGAQLRYFITVGEQIVALAGFGAAAWQTAPRDQFNTFFNDPSSPGRLGR